MHPAQALGICVLDPLKIDAPQDDTGCIRDCFCFACVSCNARNSASTPGIVIAFSTCTKAAFAGHLLEPFHVPAMCTVTYHDAQMLHVIMCSGPEYELYAITVRWPCSLTRTAICCIAVRHVAGHAAMVQAVNAYFISCRIQHLSPNHHVCYILASQ
jgi:hypothetical protein